MTSLGTDFDALLTRGALAALAAAGAWGALVVVCVALEARSAGRIRITRCTGCPLVLRHWLLGVFLAGFAGIAAPASASGSGPGAGPGDAGGVATSLDGLPLPDRTTDGSRPTAASSARVVVVRPGDSLWSIARSSLGGGVADREVAAAVTRLYAANRDTVGADPDLIVPGQRLRVDPLSDRPSSPSPLREDR